MTTNTQATTSAKSAAIKAYQDKVAAQLHEANAKLESIDATARQKKTQAEIAAIAGLNAAKQNIETQLEALKTTHESNVSRAKAEIDAEVAKLKSSVEGLAAKVKAHATKK